MNPAYLRVFGIVLLLACTAPTPALAEGPVVTQFFLVDVQGDLPAFLETFKRVRAVGERLGLEAKPRVFQATIAGPQTQMVAIAIEYPDLVSFAQSASKMAADPELQQIVREAPPGASMSRSLWTEITPK